MPLTPAETAEFDQGVASLDDNVAELARAYQDDASAYGDDAAFANAVCFLLDGADWTREELAAMLGRAVRRIPASQEEGP